MKFLSHQQIQRLLTIGAVLVLVIVLIPLIGLLLGLWAGPQHPFMGASASLADIFRQAGVLKLLVNTVSLAAIVSIFSTLVGLWFAWVEQRAQYPGVKLLGVCNLLPLAMPSFVIALTLRETFAPSSFFGTLFHLPVFSGFVAAAIVLTISTLPYSQLLLSAALKRGSLSEEEAARCLGAAKHSVFWHVVLPKLRPSFAFAWLISILYVISDFGAVAILDTPVLTWRLYQAVGYQQLSQATLLGFVIMVFSIPVLFIARALHGVALEITQVGNPRPTVRHRLQLPTLIATYSLHVLVIGLGVLLPVLTLGLWVYRGWLHQLVFAPILPPIVDTLAVSIPSALGIAVLALLPAWAVARSTGRYSGWLIEQSTYITSCLPGILLAFGLMLTSLFVSRLSTNPAFVYQLILNSGILLFLGYAMRFIAEAYAGLKSAILLFDPRLTEIARTLNTPVWTYLTKVFIPSLMPGLTVAFILVLMNLVKELPVSLLLGSAMGLRTLSYQVYDYYQQAFLHDAGLAGLVILLLSFTLLTLTLRWRRHV